MLNIKSHYRINDTLLGPLERPVLLWLAARQPPWMNPDILTVTGILGAVLIFASYWLTNLHRGFLWLACLGFVLNWYGDSLDGTLARFRDIEKPRYGYFVDHTVDSFNEVLCFLGLGLSPLMRFEVACLALISYLLMSILVFVRTAATGRFQISYAHLGPTELRLIAVLTNIGIFFFGNPAVSFRFGQLSIFDFIGVIVAVLLLVIFVVSTVRQARELSVADRQTNEQVSAEEPDLEALAEGDKTLVRD